MNTRASSFSVIATYCTLVFNGGKEHSRRMEDLRTRSATRLRFLPGAHCVAMRQSFCLFLVLFLVLPAVGVSAKPPRKTEVIIIGAGLSGLAAAYELKKAHVPFHILEIAPRVGGRVRTVRYQRPGQPEIYADSGMEEYWQSNPAVQILKELGLPISSDIAVSTIMLQNHLYPLGKDATPADFKKTLFSKD